MIASHLSEPAKQALDYSISAAGIAFFFKLLPAITGVCALLLIVLRIAVGVEEYRIKRHERRHLK